MTSTEISIIIMDDLMTFIDQQEKAMLSELSKEIKDKDKVEVLQLGALMAFESMRTSLNRMKEKALVVQAISHGVAEA